MELKMPTIPTVIITSANVKPLAPLGRMPQVLLGLEGTYSHILLRQS